MTKVKTVIAAILASQCLLLKAEAENLLDIYHKALTNDARFASARGARDAGVEKYWQGVSQLLPTLSVNGEKNYNDASIEYNGSTAFEGGERRYKDRKYSATLTQPLYRKLNFATFQQGKAQEAAAEAQFIIAKQELILRTAQAYFDMLSAQQDLATAGAHAATMQAQAEGAKAKLGVGAGTRIEASEAKARADVARVQEISARDDLATKRHALRRIINEMPGTLDELVPGFLLAPPSPNDATHWNELAENSSPQLWMLRQNMIAAEKEVDRARAGHYPNVDLFAQSSADYSTGSVYTAAASDTHTKTAGLRLEIPLYQGGVTNSRVREALGGLVKAQGDFEDARRDVASQVVQFFNGIVSGSEKVRALDQALVSSQDAAKATRVGFGVGTRNFVEVLDAEQKAYDVALDLIKAREDYVLSWLRLKAVVGQLTEEDLAMLNSYLAPSPSR